mmetsp:Transcript_7605/g.16737  ORF Transcript_7605/g.16737 Transcript_7605/m.16737 type:complete len:219 (-) Transcript_7605:788-1444(-)
MAVSSSILRSRRIRSRGWSGSSSSKLESSPTALGRHVAGNAPDGGSSKSPRGWSPALPSSSFWQSRVPHKRGVGLGDGDGSARGVGLLAPSEAKSAKGSRMAGVAELLVSRRSPLLDLQGFPAAADAGLGEESGSAGNPGTGPLSFRGEELVLGSHLLTSWSGICKRAAMTSFGSCLALSSRTGAGAFRRWSATGRRAVACLAAASSSSFIRCVSQAS